MLQVIDEYDINGDFVESQAFGFLAIRSIIKNFQLLFLTQQVVKDPLQVVK